jgi:hypothetical protein
MFCSAREAAKLASRISTRALASAVSIYSAHMGNVALALTNLTVVATNGQSQTAGPFMANVPAPPTGWIAYSYSPSTANGTFNISASGDGTTVSLP